VLVRPSPAASLAAVGLLDPPAKELIIADPKLHGDGPLRPPRGPKQFHGVGPELSWILGDALCLRASSSGPTPHWWMSTEPGQLQSSCAPFQGTLSVGCRPSRRDARP
jgi:hypothetical protein